MQSPDTIDALVADAPTVLAADLHTAKPVWHQELFDQALAIFHHASPAITTPATYEYLAALHWMMMHHELAYNVTLVGIEQAPPAVLAWASHSQLDLIIFDNPPAILIGQPGF